jgi:uncharacterized protein (DUF2147 family)
MIGALFLALVAAQAPAQNSIQGVWKSPGGNSIIEIAPCGENLCGTVVWASEKAKKDSRKATDQLVGTPLLTALEEKQEGHWQGRLFIPDKNMRVTAKIELAGPDQLKVSGCAAGKALCRSALWNRTDKPEAPTP